jgi:hypothetical protein
MSAAIMDTIEMEKQSSRNLCPGIYILIMNYDYMYCIYPEIFAVNFHIHQTLTSSSLSAVFS